MLEEANGETLALIKKLDGLMERDEDFDEFKTILSSIAPKVVDQTNYEGDCDGNLLHQAIETQKKDHVVALLEHGVDPQIPKPSSEGNISPLHLAVKCIRPYEDFNTEIFDILREATGEDIPDELKLDLLLSALYQEEDGDKDKAKAKFCEVLASLSPELVTSTVLTLPNETSVPLLQHAVIEQKTDFIRILLEHGVDPTVPVESSEDPRQKLSALELAAFYDCMDSNDALAVMAEFTEIPADLKEVLDMGTEGREQNEERLVKLFSLLKLNLF